jgi:hypothetical protein
MKVILMDNKKKIKIFERIVINVIRTMAIGFITFAIIGLIKNFNNNPDKRYIAFLVQGGWLFLATYIDLFFRRILHLKMSVFFELIFLFFMSACSLLGEICEFYVYVSWWDDLLHTFSGAFVSLIGFSFIMYLNENQKISVNLNKGFVLLFSFLLTMTIASMWEIIEYMCDLIFKTNMQTYMNDITKELYVGQNALHDTMGDIIEGMAGSLIMLIVEYLDLKKNDGRILETFNFKTPDAIDIHDKKLEGKVK